MTPTISSLVAWPGLHSLVRVSSVCPRRLPCHGASLGSQCCHPPSLVPASSHSCLQFLSCTCLKTVSEQISFILLRIPQELPVVLRVSLPLFPFSLLRLFSLGSDFLGKVTQGSLTRQSQIPALPSKAATRRLTGSDALPLVFLSLPPSVYEMLSSWGKEGRRYLRGGVS